MKKHTDAQHGRLYFDVIDNMIEPLGCGPTRLCVLFLRRYNGSNNGAIPLSVREVEAWCKCGHATAIRYLRELQERGLIEPVTVGSFCIKAGPQKMMATTWRLHFVKEAA
jgi:hypothetical protein